jgi:hypothetical protein
MTAALGAVAVTGAEQVAAAVLTLWPLLAAIACICLALIVNRLLPRRTVPLQPLPPAHEDTQPVGEIGDDTLAMIRAARREEAAERKAASDLEPYAVDSVLDAIEHMEREWREQREGDRG